MTILKLTQVKMVELTGIDKSSISKYLTGTNIPQLDTAMHISNTCKVPIQIFCDEDTQLEYMGKVFLKHDVSYKKRVEK